VFAQVLRDCARATDLPCRPGGEEVTVLLAAAGTDAAASLAERIHARLLSASAQLGVPFTVSIGLAAYPVHGGNAEEVLRCADEALYRAKDRGRNRTAVYGVADAPATPATPAFVPRRDADAA
jgi:diguanylate cyclase (GGDEF)-like protein